MDGIYCLIANSCTPLLLGLSTTGLETPGKRESRVSNLNDYIDIKFGYFIETMAKVDYEKCLIGLYVSRYE